MDKTACSHDFKKQGESKGNWELVCKKCGEPKLVPAPKEPIKESRSSKLLLG